MIVSKTSVLVLLGLIISSVYLIHIDMPGLIVVNILYFVPLVYNAKWAQEYIDEHPHLSGVENVMYMFSAMIPGWNTFIFISNWGEGNKL